MKPEKVYIFPFLIEFSNLQVRFREKKVVYLGFCEQSPKLLSVFFVESNKCKKLNTV